MTNPLFIDYAFPTADAGTIGHERTLPARLADIHNVKDFGATGAGYPTDDWAAIRACYNATTVYYTATASNLVASFTGTVSTAAANITWSGTTITASSVNGTLAIGQAIGGLIIFDCASFTYNSGTGLTTLTMTPTVSFNTGDTINIINLLMDLGGGNFGPGPNTFNVTPATVSGNTITYTAATGISGTPTGGGLVYLNKTTTITSFIGGSGGNGTYGVADSDNFTVAFAAQTDSLLVTSAVTGTITIGDQLLNNAGTDASPNELRVGSVIETSKGGGVYTIHLFTPQNTAGLLATLQQNFTVQAMMTVTNTLLLTPAVPTTLGYNIYDADNATVCGDGLLANGSLAFDPPNVRIASGVGGLVNINDTIGLQKQSKGTIYFPPGDYYVSQPIDFTAGNAEVIWQGDIGTTVTGNFDDFVFLQLQANSVCIYVERFNVINLHPTGGGIRLGGTNVGGIRDCNITANRGVSDYSSDGNVSAYYGSFEMTFENITVTAGANYSGSYGIARQTDGPLTNCRVTGSERGFITAGGEGAQALLGCSFEKCDYGIVLNRGPDGGAFVAGNMAIAGCWIKDCIIGIAIPASSGGLTLIGTRIEGTAGQGPSGADPQYGIVSGDSSGNQSHLNRSMIAGLTVVGEFTQSGIFLAGFSFFNYAPIFIGCADASTCPNPFDLDTFNGNSYIPMQIGCSAKHIYTVATIPTTGYNVGEILNVIDGTNGLNWGDPITNTGTHTTHYAVQWNGVWNDAGGHWTVVGK